MLAYFWAPTSLWTCNTVAVNANYPLYLFQVFAAYHLKTLQFTLCTSSLLNLLEIFAESRLAFLFSNFYVIV